MQEPLLKGKRHRFYENVKWAMRPYKKQQEVVDALWGHTRNPEGGLYRFFCVVFGRQSGKSFLAKYVALRRAIEFGHSVMWVAPSSNNVNNHWTELHSMIVDSGIPTKKITQKPREIRFYGGGSIQVRSALEGTNLRGSTLDLLILDEASFFENGNDLWFSVLQPMITASRGQVMFTTTPNGRNWVYDIFQRGLEPNKYYVSWHMKSEDSPYQDKELLRDLKKSMPQMKWAEEYEAEFLTDSGGVFAGVDKASNVQMLTEPEDNARYIAGIDWGDVEDYTVFTVLDKVERKQVYGERFSGIGTKYQLEKVINLLEKWKPEKVYVERNGMGHTMFKMLVETITGKTTLLDAMEKLQANIEQEGSDQHVKFGNTTVIGVHIDNKMKRELVERTVADIEYGRLFLLSEEGEGRTYAQTQKSEMSTYERKRTTNGVQVTYSAVKGAHDDTVSALILAMRGMPKPKVVKWWKKDDNKLQENPFRKHRKPKKLRRR